MAIMQETLYRVQLDEIFEGPMDLLVHLIRKNELDIYEIPIALITEQYLQYLEWMKAMNIDYAGDFLLMASTLTQLKSRMLLPRPVDDEDEEELDGDDEARLFLPVFTLVHCPVFPFCPSPGRSVSCSLRPPRGRPVDGRNRSRPEPETQGFRRNIKL